MTEHEERIATLRVELHRRRELYEHARRELDLAQAAVYEAEGDDLFARWYRALAVRDTVASDRCATEWANREGSQP